MARYAITRPVPDSFASALAAVPPDPPIDPALAQAQHARYRAALAALGLEVIDVPEAPRCPDSTFVEDTAVVAGGVALMTWSAAPSRRDERAAVAGTLARFAAIEWMAGPATLDGGDCLRLGRTLYVGRSPRSNGAGVARLREVFEPRGFTIVPVTLPAGVLHLKCLCSPLGDGRVLLARSTLPASLFGGAGVVWVPEEEGYAANAVAHDGGVIVAEGFPRTREALEAAGYRVLGVPTSESRKADGSLTCLSILVDADAGAAAARATLRR